MLLRPSPMAAAANAPAGVAQNCAVAPDDSRSVC
jgi:hypothetical protein